MASKICSISLKGKQQYISGAFSTTTTTTRYTNLNFNKNTESSKLISLSSKKDLIRDNNKQSNTKLNLQSS